MAVQSKRADLVTVFCSTLRSVAPSHPLMEDLAAKEALFDEAAGRFSVSASA